jgi:hypothetical protein
MSSSGAKLNGTLPGVPGVPGSAAIVNSATKQVAAANVAAAVTLPGAVGKTTYLTTLIMCVGIAAAAVELAASVTGIITNQWPITLVGTTGSPCLFFITLDTPLPASAPNTAIVCTIPASGAAGPSIAVSALGFQL